MKRYQAVAFLLSTAMTVSSAAPVFGASNDVFGHWAEFTITKWQNEGRIGGYEDGTFKPDKSITRAEFVRLLNSAVPTAFTSSNSVNFSDVKESDWFFADVSKAVGSGVTSGFEDGTFRPSETVTRIQAAVFIAKAKGLTPNEAAANNFTDAASIPAWAKGAVGAAVSAGYLSGYPDGSFGGSKGMTRAEAVSTLDRVLGGTSTSNQTPSQGEIDTTDRDSQQKEETTTTAKSGDMVWASGGSGGGRKSSSSSGGGSSSSSSNVVSKAVSIRSQSDANDYKGKTLTGKATIYAKDGLELQDIRFKGDVDIIADSTATAAAYIENDTAVAAAYLSNINIYFEGRTNISGTITVIRDGVPASTQVIIRTRTPRAISAIVKALLPTKIVGFEVPRVEAKAPVEVAKDAKVGTVTADDGASVKAEGEVDNVNVVGKVDNIELSGTGNTDVTVDDGASVEKIDVKDDVKANVEVNGNAEVKNVAVSGNASAGVDVKDTATVGNVAVSDSAAANVDVKDTAKVDKVDIADSATANVDVAPEAKVDKVTSTSTAAGSSVTGTGEVGKIESTNPGTLEKGEEVTTPVETPPTTDDNTGTADPTPEKLDAKATASDVEWKIGGDNTNASSKITLDGATFNFDNIIDDEWKVEGDAKLTGKVNADADNKTLSVTFDEGTGELAKGELKYTLTIPARNLDPADDKHQIPTDGVPVTIKVNVTDASEQPPVTVTGISIKETNQNEIAVGKKLSYTAVLEGENITNTEKAAIKWTVAVKDSSQQDIIENSGVSITPATGETTELSIPATGVSAGTKITLTATYGEGAAAKTKDLLITVVDAPDDADGKALIAAIKDGIASKTIEIPAASVTDEAAIKEAIETAAEELRPNGNKWTPVFTIGDISGLTVDANDKEQDVPCTLSATYAGSTVEDEAPLLEKVSVTVKAAEEITDAVTFTLTKPAIGEVPATTATVTNDQYAVEGNVVWKTKAANGEFTDAAPAKFAAKGEYQATVTLKAKAGYKFVDSSAKVATDIVSTDDGTAEKGEVATGNHQNTMTVVVTYKALPEGSGNDQDANTITAVKLKGLPTVALTTTTTLPNVTVDETDTNKDKYEIAADGVKWYKGTKAQNATTVTWNDSTTVDKIEKDGYYKAVITLNAKEISSSTETPKPKYAFTADTTANVGVADTVATVTPALGKDAADANDTSKLIVTVEYKTAATDGSGSGGDTETTVSEIKITEVTKTPDFAATGANNAIGTDAITVTPNTIELAKASTWTKDDTDTQNGTWKATLKFKVKSSATTTAFGDTVTVSKDVSFDNTKISVKESSNPITPSGDPKTVTATLVYTPSTDATVTAKSGITDWIVGESAGSKTLTIKQSGSTAPTVEDVATKLTPSEGATMKVLSKTDASDVTVANIGDKTAQTDGTALANEMVLCVISESGTVLTKYTITVQEPITWSSTTTGKYDITEPSSNGDGTIKKATTDGTDITTATQASDFLTNLGTPATPTGAVVKLYINDEMKDDTTPLAVGETIVKVFPVGTTDFVNTTPLATYNVIVEKETITSVTAPTLPAESAIAGTISNVTIPNESDSSTTGYATKSEWYAENNGETGDKIADTSFTSSNKYRLVVTLTAAEGKKFVDGNDGTDYTAISSISNLVSDSVNIDSEGTTLTFTVEYTAQ